MLGMLGQCVAMSIMNLSSCLRSSFDGEPVTQIFMVFSQRVSVFDTLFLFPLYSTENAQVIKQSSALRRASSALE